MIVEENLRQAIRLTQAEFRRGIGHAGIIDVGFIGNTSGAYVWEPALIVDIDVCLFVERKDVTLGHWLEDVRNRLRAAVDLLGVDFELKVLRGPYKTATWRPLRPVAIAHMAVFTETSYQREPAAIRWSWRKYRCIVEPDRLRTGGGAPPDWRELHTMAVRKLARIRAVRIEMTEWELPEFVERRREFTADHPVFAEYCLAGPMVCARAHARILRYTEADQLGNRDFVKWYRRAVLDTAALEELIGLKEIARRQGYAGLIPAAGDLAGKYLTVLIQHIESRG